MSGKEDAHSWNGTANNSLSDEVDEFEIFLDKEAVEDLKNETRIFMFTILEQYPPTLLSFAGVSCILFAIIGILSNGISIAALINARKLRNVTTKLIINLCVVDFFYCCFPLPLAASNFLFPHRWMKEDGLCTAFAMIRFVSATLSIFTVVVITVNRYVLMVHHDFYRKIFRKHALKVIIPGLYVVSILMLTPTLFNAWGRFGYNPQVGSCSILPNEKESTPKLFLFVTSLILPSLVFILCYSRIFWVVRKSHLNVKRTQGKELQRNISVSGNSNSNDVKETVPKSPLPKRLYCRAMSVKNLGNRSSMKLSKDMRLLRTILVIFIFFIVCYLPISIVKILNCEKDHPVITVLGELGIYLYYCMNPIIYVVMCKEYRRAYVLLLTCNRNETTSSVSNTQHGCSVNNPKANVVSPKSSLRSTGERGVSKINADSPIPSE